MTFAPKLQASAAAAPSCCRSALLRVNSLRLRCLLSQLFPHSLPQLFLYSLLSSPPSARYQSTLHRPLLPLLPAVATRQLTGQTSHRRNRCSHSLFLLPTSRPLPQSLFNATAERFRRCSLLASVCAFTSIIAVARGEREHPNILGILCCHWSTASYVRATAAQTRNETTSSTGNGSSAKSTPNEEDQQAMRLQL